MVKQEEEIEEDEEEAPVVRTNVSSWLACDHSLILQ